MFDREFYPTPHEVIDRMINGYDVNNKIILEPSAGSGNIVSHLLQSGAKEVIASEKDKNLLKILKTKCKVISEDFITVTSEMISHIDMIIMNPPFSNADTHILHAYNIAPAGCDIIALCNQETIKNRWTQRRSELFSIIDNYGSVEFLGNVFNSAERTTDAGIALIRIKKSGNSNKSEFDGFFIYEEVEQQENGIMSYNVVRDLVNRYTGAIRIFDEQLQAAIKLNNLTNGFYSSKIGFSVTEKDAPKTRNDFKKDLQKAGWKFIFSKMNMNKYATKGLKDDINKFVEHQTEIPFTMRNIYHMIDIVIGTNSQRMDKALIEVFDKLTEHHHDNRYNVEGWKTNSHYLVNRKFIMPYLFNVGYGGEVTVNLYHNRNNDILDDFVKALCYLNGDNYDGFKSLYQTCNREANLEFGKWHEFTYFRFKAFKKGTGHFEFLDEKLWHKFNQNVARIKGFELYEPKSKK